MTLIECFDPIPIRNALACLRLQPDKVIFLGDMEIMESKIHAYRQLFTRRAKHTQIELHHARLDDLNNIYHTLKDIVDQEDECVIDVTGGAEQLLMAVGALTIGQKEKKLSVQKFDLRGGNVVDVDGDGKTVCGQEAQLTAQELIRLQGGTVYPYSPQPAQTYRPGDIQKLWELACENPRSWNKTIAYLNEFESRNGSGMEISLSIKSVAASIRNFEEKEAAVRTLLEKMDRCGIITDRSNALVLRYEYRDPIFRDCVKKAGNILEIKTLLEARALMQDGKPCFCDCQMGVTIEWEDTDDGQEDQGPETRNEIDVLLMRGTVPLFISCKNGDVEEAELYKLHTVAERFGSRFAKKMLIATDLKWKGETFLQAYRQRANDMGIHLVTNAAELTARQWREIFREAMEM